MIKNISQLVNTMAMYNQMMGEIKKSGGLFYQYRACTRSFTTIYDIDNIRNGVAFARPPLEMNDPFDSQIGYSAEEICNECIDMVLENMDAEAYVKSLLRILLKNKVLGKFAEFLKAINDLKLFLLKQRRDMYQLSLPLDKFVNQYGKILYKKSPANVKQLIRKDDFLLVCKLAANFENTEITEEKLSAFLHVEEMLDNFQQQIDLLMNDKYVPSLRNLLSKMPISCFSAAGWDCPLMWAHYANSYKGICVEYDFKQLDGFIGFVKRVQYSPQRPTILLKDMGIVGIDLGKEESVKYADANLDNIFNYLLTKDTCWDYEKEWRIITICNEPVSQHFYPVPFITSITLGLNVDYLCKRMILDVCQEKEIECYQLKLGHDNFKLTREKINIENVEFDPQTELDYLTKVTKDIQEKYTTIDNLSDEIATIAQSGELNPIVLQSFLEQALSLLELVYFLKLSCNRNCTNSTISGNDLTELQKDIRKLEEYTNMLPELTINLHEIIQQIFANGNINKTSHDNFIKTIKTITDLLNKYKSIAWHVSIIKSN